MSRRPFFKFYFQDFADGCRKAKMSPEQVGMYVMTLGYIWEDEGSIAPDMSVLGVRTGWGKRLCTRLVGELRGLGKLIEIEDGRLSNDRMVREIEAFVLIKKAAQEREEKRRGSPSKSLYSRSIVALETDYNGTRDQLNSKKDNKNNKTKSTNEAPSEHIPEARSQKEEVSEERNNLGAPKGGAQVISKNSSLDPRGSAPSSVRASDDKLDPYRRRRVALPENDLTGLYGIEFQDGRLRIMGGIRDEIQAEFPGVDLDAVCLKAAPKIAALKHKPNRDFILATIRQYAQFAVEDMAKQQRIQTQAPRQQQSRDTLSPKYRAKVEAARLARQGSV